MKYSPYNLRNIMSNIKLIKFNSGEEIIASFKSKDDSGVFIVEDTVTLVYHRNEAGAVSVGFSPFMPYSEGDISIYKSSIASTSEVKSDLLSEYNRIFSKIEIAPAGLIVK
jgi:hypothetical protein